MVGGGVRDRGHRLHLVVRAVSGATGHFWAQRLTAVALVPLSLWFVIQVLSLLDASHAQVEAWLAVPFNAVLVLTLLGAMIWHSMLGLQVVVEDYVHTRWAKLALLGALRFSHFGIGVVAIVAVLRVMTGSA